MIKIEFHVDDSNLKDLAQRYWARSDSGAWAESVEAIAKQTGISKTKIPTIVKEAASAYLTELSCSACNQPTLLLSRSDFTSQHSHLKFLTRANSAYENREFNYLCSECKEVKRKSEFEIQKNLENEKKNRIYAALSEVSERRFDFSTIEFLDAVYCYAIKLACGIDDYSNKNTINPSQLFITSRIDKQIDIFKYLFSRGVVVISKSSPVSAFDIGVNGVTYAPDKVQWEFALDVNDFDSETIVDFIENSLNIPNSDSLCELWRVVAQYECEAYFHEVCERWGLNNWTFTESKREAITYALKNYSIPQVWNFIYCETRNLAAQVNAGTFNRKHVENMFSGNIRRRADKWFANSWSVEPWKRRTFEKECYLTSIVFDSLFGGGDRDWSSITSSTVRTRAEEVVAAASSD
jgi:hypothetical protein